MQVRIHFFDVFQFFFCGILFRTDTFYITNDTPAGFSSDFLSGFLSIGFFSGVSGANYRFIVLIITVFTPYTESECAEIIRWARELDAIEKIAKQSGANYSSAHGVWGTRVLRACKTSFIDNSESECFGTRFFVCLFPGIVCRSFF